MNRKINKLMITVSIIVFLGASLIAYACSANIIDNFWKILLTTVFSTVASIGGIALLWELVAKKSFSNDLFQMANISSNLKESGIENIFFYNDVDWKHELQNIKTLKIFFAYGSTFRNNNRDSLKKIKSLTVYLPDLEDDLIVENLDFRFSKGKYSTQKEESVRKKIFDAICEFKEMNAKVYLHKMIQTHTLYVLDKVCILANYKHYKDRSNVLTLKANNEGTIYRFIKEEFESIHKYSKEVTKEEYERLRKKFLGEDNE